MTRRIQVIFAGCIVLLAVVSMIASTMFLRGGHPPAYGIVNLLILFVAYPVSIYGAIVGLTTPRSSAADSPKIHFSMVSICSLFALLATVLFVLKFGFGKAI